MTPFLSTTQKLLLAALGGIESFRAFGNHDCSELCPRIVDLLSSRQAVAWSMNWRKRKRNPTAADDSSVMFVLSRIAEWTER
jgi:hypothetical protein